MLAAFFTTKIVVTHKISSRLRLCFLMCCIILTEVNDYVCKIEKHGKLPFHVSDYNLIQNEALYKYSEYKQLKALTV